MFSIFKTKFEGFKEAYRILKQLAILLSAQKLCIDNIVTIRYKTVYFKSK